MRAGWLEGLTGRCTIVSANGQTVVSRMVPYSVSIPTTFQVPQDPFATGYSRGVDTSEKAERLIGLPYGQAIKQGQRVYDGDVTPPVSSNYYKITNAATDTTDDVGLLVKAQRVETT